MSGNNGLGDATTGGGYAARTVEANGSISAGDFVALDQTAGDNNVPQIVQLNTGNTSEDQLAGVAKEDLSNGDKGTVQTDGWLVANVATGISMGERLGSGGTAGRAASEDGGHAVAWSNEGGTDQTGTNLGGNEAEVYLG
jgi:hypothetical protein